MIDDATWARLPPTARRRILAREAATLRTLRERIAEAEDRLHEAEHIATTYIHNLPADVAGAIRLAELTREATRKASA